MRGAQSDQRIARSFTLQVRRAQQQMLGRNVLVLERRSLAKRLVKDFIERLAHTGLARRAGNARQFLLNRMQLMLQPFRRHANLSQHGRDHALAVLDQRQQQMDRLHLGISEFRSPRLCLRHCLLRLDRQFVPTNSHYSSSCHMSALEFRSQSINLMKT